MLSSWHKEQAQRHANQHLQLKGEEAEAEAGSPAHLCLASAGSYEATKLLGHEHTGPQRVALICRSALGQ